MLANPGSERAPVAEEWPLTIEGAEALVKQLKGREAETSSYYVEAGKENQQAKLGKVIYDLSRKT